MTRHIAFTGVGLAIMPVHAGLPAGASFRSASLPLRVPAALLLAAIALSAYPLLLS